MSFNKIIIVGYLGRDPELRYTPQGTAVCKFSVATTEKRKSANSETAEEITTWFRVTTWGRQAELASEYLSKGRQVYIEGRLRLEEYVDREGQTRTSLEVTALDLQFLGQRSEAGAANTTETVNKASEKNEAESKAEKKQAIAKALGTTAAPLNKGKKPTARPAKELLSIEEDDIPF
jgi:single-strand DNA-binding protein